MKLFYRAQVLTNRTYIDKSKGRSVFGGVGGAGGGGKGRGVDIVSEETPQHKHLRLQKNRRRMHEALSANKGTESRV